MVTKVGNILWIVFGITVGCLCIFAIAFFALIVISMAIVGSTYP